MREDTSRPQINLSKIPVGGGIAGAIFAIGSMLIFLLGIPVLRYVIHFMRHETPGAAWIMPKKNG